jgi:hypothetical protein
LKSLERDAESSEQQLAIENPAGLKNRYPRAQKQHGQQDQRGCRG